MSGESTIPEHEEIHVLATKNGSQSNDGGINVDQIAVMVNNEEYEKAVEHLRILLKKQPKDGYLNYLYAFCVHNSKSDYTTALNHYDLALQYGYDEFWVRYSRSFLFRELIDFERARADLEKAVSLDPENEQARLALAGLQKSDSNNDKKIVLRSPVLVSSLPKSGTMLLHSILLSVLGDDLVVPSNYYTVPLVTSEYIQSLPELTNRIYFGHIWYSDDLAKIVSSIPKITLIRDPRDNVVSHTHFLEGVTNENWSKGQHDEYWSQKDYGDKLSSVIFGMPSPNNYPPSILDAFLNYAIKWGKDNTLFVRYEDIISSGHYEDNIKVRSTIKSIIEFIGVKDIDEDVLGKKIAFAADPGRSSTFRSGGIGGWRKEFKASHVKQMKWAAPGLVSAFGYEPDEKWDLVEKKINAPSNVNSTFRFPKIDIESVTKLESRTLNWDEYMQIKKELVGEVARNKEISKLTDEWALNIFISRNQFSEALSILKDLLTLTPHQPRWNFQSAYCLQMQGKDLKQAVEYYTLALNNGFPQEFWIRYNRGRLLFALGDLTTAMHDLERALILKPTDKRAKQKLDEIQRAYEGPDPKSIDMEIKKVAAADLPPYTTPEEDAKISEIRAEMIDKKSDYENAIVELTPLLNKLPMNAKLNYLMAYSLHRLNKNPSQAINYYNQALQSGFDEFWVRYNRGSLFKDIRDFEKARVDLQRAAELNPGHEATHKILQEIKQSELSLSDLHKVRKLVYSSDYQKAETHLQELLNNFPNNAEMNYLYAYCLHMMKKNPDKTIHHYNIALHAGFDEFWVRYNRGSFFFSLGDLYAAKDDLEGAIDLQPNYQDAIQILGQVKGALEKSNGTKSVKPKIFKSLAVWFARKKIPDESSGKQ